MKTLRRTHSFALPLLLAWALGGCNPQSSGGTDGESALDLDTLISTKTFVDVQGGDSLKIGIEVNLIYPKEGELSREVLHRFFEEFEEEASAKAYVERFYEVNSSPRLELTRGEALAEEIGAPALLKGQSWSTELSSDVCYLDSEILSLKRREVVDQGGAHAYERVQYYSFLRETASVLKEEALFVEDYKEELGALLRAQLMTDYGAKQVEEMQDEGFASFGEISSNGNFYLTDSEIVYCFNPYEIAPYSMGVITVHLPYERLLSLLSEESIIRRYLDL